MSTYTMSGMIITVKVINSSISCLISLLCVCCENTWNLLRVMAIVNSTVLYIGNLQWWSCNDLGLKKNSKKNADMSFSFNLTLCINYKVSVDELFIKLESIQCSVLKVKYITIQNLSGFIWARKKMYIHVG